MARSISQALTHRITIVVPNRAVTVPVAASLPSPRFLRLRTQSNHSSSSNDLDSLSTDPLIRKLEDAIHCIIARRSAPDWLPFRPGSSYWVPPLPAGGSSALPQLLEKLANPLTPEESLSTTTVRGWPSSSFFIQGGSQLPVEVVGIPSNSSSQTEDDEEV